MTLKAIMLRISKELVTMLSQKRLSKAAAYRATPSKYSEDAMH
jgi:hypothetical protein